MKYVEQAKVSKLCFWNKSQINLELSQTEARKIESAAVFRLRIFLSLEFIIVAIGVSRSPKFVKHLELVQK